MIDSVYKKTQFFFIIFCQETQIYFNFNKANISSCTSHRVISINTEHPNIPLIHTAFFKYKYSIFIFKIKHHSHLLSLHSSPPFSRQQVFSHSFFFFFFSSSSCMYVFAPVCIYMYTNILYMNLCILYGNVCDLLSCVC